MNNKTDMFGRTMFETIAAISVVGLITAGVAKIAGTALERYKLSRIGQNVIDLQKAINFRYMAKGNYKDLKWDKMKQYVPFELRGQTHAFGGDIEIGGIKVDGEQDDDMLRRYYVQFDNLPDNACTALGDMQWGYDGSSSLVYIKIGEKDEIEKEEKKDEIYENPVSINKLDELCVNGVSMKWVFE